jgi:hypothetical protein
MAGGSWATDDSVDKVVKRLGQIVVEDWGSLFDVEGRPLEVDVFDVGERHWQVSARGCQDKETKEWLEPISTVTVILPRRRRRA